ncbi:hypothetical protein F5B21DRAFT_520270 [Xylaria acuta]|nr:hypothetical protein F5B21DRAFT_520270 [Xylaria acuta]
MKRQQSTRGSMLPKRHCPTRQFAAQTQDLMPSTNQAGQYLYSGNQAYSHLPEQLAQQPAHNPYCSNNNHNNPYNYHYNSNYNHANSTNNSVDSQNSNGLLQDNNIANSWNKPVQYSPSQFTPAELTTAQFAPLQFAPAQLTSTPFTSAQFAPAQRTPTGPTDVGTGLNMTPGVNFFDSDIPLPYPTHAPNLVSQVGFPMENSWDMSVLHNPPQQPNQPIVNGQLCEPKPNQPDVNVTAVSVGTAITQNGPNGWNNTNGASLHLPRRGVYGAQVPKPPQKRRKPTKRGESEVDSDFVDLVMMSTRTSKSSTSSPVVKVPLAPVVDQSTEPSRVPNSKEPNGDRVEPSVKPCEAPDNEAILEAGIGALKEHLKILEKQEAEVKRAREEKKRDKAEKKRAEAFEWPGDPSEYPAECFANMRLPGCEFRAHAICIGSPRPGLPRDQYKVPPKGRLLVYAVRQGSDGVEFKLVEPQSTPEEVMQASEIQFKNINLNVNFSDMDELKVIRWSRYLLDAVPGRNDSVTMWSKS